MTEQEVRAFHKRYFSLRDFMEPEETRSKWSVIAPLAVAVPKTSGDHQADIPRKRDHQAYTPPLRLRISEIRSMDRTRTSRLVEEICIPERTQAHGRKEKAYKNGDPRRS